MCGADRYSSAEGLSRKAGEAGKRKMERVEEEVFGFEGINIIRFILYLARWLSWLERRPVTAEVEGSSPFWVVQVE